MRHTEKGIRITRPMGCPRARRFRQVLQNIKKRGNNWQEIEKRKLWEGRKDLRVSIHSPL
jgi:hypothetical protein